MDSGTTKNPVSRKLGRKNSWILWLMIIVSFLGAKWYWLIDVSASLKSTQGIVQRAQAFQKLIDYNYYMDMRTHGGRWARSIVLWPIEPTEVERAYANEFLYLSSRVYNIAKDEMLICNVNYDLNLNNAKASDEKIAISTLAAEYVLNIGAAEFENSAMLLLSALQSEYRCRN